MKDKYEILNDVKINIEEYEEVKFDNNDNIKIRMKDKIKVKKSPCKKGIIAASLAVALGSGVIFNETAWANVEKIWYKMETLLASKRGEFSYYKYEINKSVEYKNIKVLYKTLMIDEGNLVVEMNIDDSKFDPFEDLTKKQQKDWNLDKWGHREKYITLDAYSMEAYVDGIKLVSKNMREAPELSERKSDKTTDIVGIVPIDAIGKDGDQFYTKEISKDKFPYTIDKDKTYNLTLKVRKIFLVTESSKEEQTSYSGDIKGDWSVDVDIKGEDLIKSTLKYDEYEIEKSVDVNIDGIEDTIDLKSIKVSPFKVKFYYGLNGDGFRINEKYNLEFKLVNEEGKEYQLKSITPLKEDGKDYSNVKSEYMNIFKDNKVIKAIPILHDYENDKIIEFKDQTIEIDLSK